MFSEMATIRSGLTGDFDVAAAIEPPILQRKFTRFNLTKIP
jgi:hypothetical protein